MNDKTTKAEKDDPGFDKHWHLAKTDHEINVAELEFALMRSQEAFSRWQSECLAAASGVSMSGSETALLHVVRLHDRPKPLKELARLTNRDDIPSLQYALRKLVKQGLVEQRGGRANALYVVTGEGRKVTEKYGDLRSDLLISYTDNINGFDEELLSATRLLNLLTGMYEQAARVVATHQRMTPQNSKD
jgi:predicted MarR family transcription regulator